MPIWTLWQLGAVAAFLGSVVVGGAQGLLMNDIARQNGWRTTSPTTLFIRAIGEWVLHLVVTVIAVVLALSFGGIIYSIVRIALWIWLGMSVWALIVFGLAILRGTQAFVSARHEQKSQAPASPTVSAPTQPANPASQSQQIAQIPPPSPASLPGVQPHDSEDDWPPTIPLEAEDEHTRALRAHLLADIHEYRRLYGTKGMDKAEQESFLRAHPLFEEFVSFYQTVSHERRPDGQKISIEDAVEWFIFDKWV